MDLINGHYLGDRCAMQEQRVFKYADKGFGIRILPSYLRELEMITDDAEKRNILRLDDVKCWNQTKFYELVEDARTWTKRAIKGIAKSEGWTSVATISHSTLQERIQNSEDPPRRSVLSGLSLFMRHVALWEQEVVGTVVITKDTWAAPMYDNIYPMQFGTSYNDAPDYSWDESFTIEEFVKNMTTFNWKERAGLSDTMETLFDCYPSQRYRLPPRPDLLLKHFGEDLIMQRISHATSAEDILKPECDMYLSVWLPKAFIEFAENLIPERVQESAAMPDYTTKAFMPLALNDGPPLYENDSERLELVIWHITSTTMWQQLDRTIDEVHEVLWSFYLANAGLVAIKKEDRFRLLVGQFGRRAIRLTAQDEYAEFARWVARQPASFAKYFDPYIAYLRQYSDFEESDLGRSVHDDSDSDEDEE